MRNNKFALLLIIIAIIIEVQCDKEEKLQCLQERLTIYSKIAAEKVFPKLEISPKILHGKNNGVIAIASIPYIASETSRLTINLEFVHLKKNCSITPKWLSSEIFSYQVDLQGDNKIIISLKLRLLSPFKYYWDIIVLEPITCEYESKHSIAVNNPLSGFITRSIKLIPKKFNFDILAELTNHLTSKTSKLVTISFNETIKNENQQIRKQIKIEYINLKPVANETIIYDDNSEQYYFIKNINSSNSKLWPVKYGNLSKVGYELNNKKEMTDAIKAISLDNGHVTFCYGEIFTNKSITCKMFETETAKEFADVSVDVKEPLMKIMVKNIDENNTLVVWIESPNNGFNVMAQIIEGKKLWDATKVFYTKELIDYVIYYQENEAHCLYVGLRDFDKSTIRSYCFLVNSDCTFEQFLTKQMVGF